MRFRTNDSFGPKQNYIGKAPATAFQAFTLGQGQRLVLAERTGAKIRSFNIPKDLTIHFQLNPDGSLPRIAAVGQRLIRNMTEGGMHAYQNRRDLQTLVTALFNEGMVETQLAHKIDMAKALPEALTRLRRMSPSVDRLMSDFEVSTHKVRLMATEDPRLAPDTLFEGAQVHENLPDTFIQKGAMMRLKDGETRLVGFGNIMAAYSRDADGDYMLLFHFAHTGGKKSYAIGHKYPGYKRHGVIEMVPEFDLGNVLRHAEKQIFRATPEGFKGALRPHEYSGLGADVMLQKLAHRTSLDRKLRSGRGFHGMSEVDQKAYEELVIHQLTATADTGRQHTKVVYKELFEAMGEAMKQGDLSVSELNDFFAGSMNIGNFRFEQLELKILKTAKSGGAAQQLHSTNLEEFRMVLTEAANFGVMGYKKLYNMSAVDKVRMLAAIVGEKGTTGLSDLNSAAYKKIEEAFMYPLAAGMKRVENPFVESLYRSGVQKRMAGQSNFFGLDTGEGIFETMTRSGLYELRPILTSSELISPELQPYAGDLKAVFQRGFQGELYSPVGGFGTVDAAGNTVVNAPVLRTGVVANLKKNTTEVVAGEELLRRHLNRTVGSTFKFRHRGQTHEVAFGRAEGVFQRTNVATDRTLAGRLAEGFLTDDGPGSLDAMFTGAAENLPIKARRARMAEYIQQVAATGTDEEYRTILARAHSLMKGGKNVARRFQEELKDVTALLGPDHYVSIGLSGQVRLGDPKVVKATANQLSLLLPHETNDPREFVEAMAMVQRNLKLHLADFAGKIKGGMGTVVEMGDETGQLWRLSGAFGASPRRAGKVTSQMTQSVQVRNLTLGYTNIDTTAMLQEDARFAHLSADEIAEKYLNNGDGLTARYKEFGEGAAYLTDDFRLAAMEARRRHPLPGIEVRHVPTPEEIATHGLVSREIRNPMTGKLTTRWYQPAFNGDFRDFTKVVDEFGSWKIEPTPLRSAKTMGGETLHGIMPIGELFGKSEGGLLGLITIMGQEQGLSRDEIVSLLKDVQNEEAEILSLRSVLEPDALRARLDAMLEDKFLRVGFTREMVETVTEEGEKHLSEQLVRRGATLGAVMSSVERPKNLDPTGKIQIGSAPGQENLEQTSSDFLQFLQMQAEEHGTPLTLHDGTPITKSLISDLIKTAGLNDELKTIGFENIHAGEVLRQMLGITDPELQSSMNKAARIYFGGSAERLGQAAAAAESIGGIAMKKTAEHLGAVVEGMTAKAKGAPAAMIAGGALLLTMLQGHHEKEKKRHRPFLPR